MFRFCRVMEKIGLACGNSVADQALPQLLSASAAHADASATKSSNQVSRTLWLDRAKQRARLVACRALAIPESTDKIAVRCVCVAFFAGF